MAEGFQEQHPGERVPALLARRYNLFESINAILFLSSLEWSTCRVGKSAEQEPSMRCSDQHHDEIPHQIMLWGSWSFWRLRQLYLYLHFSWAANRLSFMSAETGNVLQEQLATPKLIPVAGTRTGQIAHCQLSWTHQLYMHVTGRIMGRSTFYQCQCRTALSHCTII